MICRHFNIHYWRENTNFLHILTDMFSQNVLWIMVMSGVLMGRILKYWSSETQQKQQIQTSQLQMEAEFMKAQVSPSLLCRTLHKSGESAQKAPKETSGMLMLLSRMLRYQLYDCRHEKVLLESEIKFLNEYLSILKYNEACLSFSISVTGQTVGILIPPLLFVPFLQSEEIPGKHSDIDIRLIIHDHFLTFELRDHYLSRNDENIRRRLDQLYPRKYNLVVEPEHVVLKIQIQ